MVDADTNRALADDSAPVLKTRSTRSKGTGALGDITNLEGKTQTKQENAEKEVRRSKVCDFLIPRVFIIFLFE
jgi:hypothetical protein